MTDARPDLDDFAALAELAKAHERPGVRELGARMVCWMESRTAGSLSAALGVRRRSGPSVSQVERIEARDQALRAVAAACWRELAPQAAAPQIVQAFWRYKKSRWPGESALIAAPAQEPAATFWRILRSGAAMPEAARVAQILRENIHRGELISAPISKLDETNPIRRSTL